MFVAAQEPEIQSASERSSSNPTTPTYSLGTNIVPKRFPWFLDMLYPQALAIRSTSFHVNSLLLTEDMSCRKWRVPCEANNYWVSNRTYGNLGNSIKTEWNGLHCRMTTEWKRNINFLLAPNCTYIHTYIYTNAKWLCCKITSFVIRCSAIKWLVSVLMS